MATYVLSAKLITSSQLLELHVGMKLHVGIDTKPECRRGVHRLESTLASRGVKAKGMSERTKHVAVKKGLSAWLPREVNSQIWACVSRVG